MEVAALGLRIDGIEGIDRAATSLDGLAAAGVKAEKSTQGVGRGSAGAKPSVDALAASADKAAQAEARLAAQAEKAGISVGQMKAALRGVPAQFTDIAVSLQGGMSPLTVFLQQGGQLKDMFGGAGNAARALGGYVRGLVNPYTVATAAVAAIGVAYYQGSKEQDAFMVSMAKTGNAAGLTTSALTSYAQQISATTGTQGKAAESLNTFIESGVKAGAGLVRLTETAIAWEKATGEGVDKVAAKYVALQKDPLSAAMKLNEGMNFLTLSVYEQVKSLEEQGRTTDAAKVAMEALDGAMAERAKNIEQNLGAIQKAWNGVAGAAKWAWDKMLNVGREDSIDQQLSKARESLDKLQTEAPGLMEKGTHAARLKRMQEVVSGLEAQSAAEALNAAATQHSAEAVAAKSAWDKIVTSNLSKQEKLEIALANVRERAAAAGITGQALEAQLAAEREKYADKTKKSTVAVNAAKTAYESLIVSINEKIAATKSELASGDKQSEADKLRARYQQELTTRSRQFTDAQRKKIETDLDAYAALEQQLIAARALEKAWDDDSKALEAYTKKQDDNLKSVNESIAKMEEEEAGHVLAARAGISHAEAMQQLVIARLEDARAQMLQGAGSADEVERINQEIAARQKLLGVVASTDARKESEKSAEESVKAWKKALDDMEKESERTSQTIGDTLSDYIMGGGKNAAQYLKRLFATMVLQPTVNYGVQGAMNAVGLGGGGGTNIMGLAQNASSLYNTGSTVAGWLGFGGSAAASGLGLTAAGTGVGLTGSLGAGYGLAAGAGTGLGLTAGSAGAGAIGAGLGTSAAAGGAGAAAGASSLMTGVMAAAPYLAAVVALYAIIAGMDDSGTPHSGAGAIYSKATGVQDGAGIYNQDTFGMGHRDEYNEEMQAGISGIAKGLGQTLDAFAVSFGKTAGYSVATAYADDSSDDGSWGSLKIMDQLGNKLVDWSDNRASKWAPREFADGKEGYEEYLKAVAVDVKAAFLAMDLPGWADQALKTATDIDTLNAALQEIATVKSVLDGLGKTMVMFADLSGDLQTRLLAASGGVEALASNAGAFYEGFYTEGERALKQRELQMAELGRMGLYIDPAEGDAAKELFRKTVQDAMGSGQVELAAQLLSMSGAFASTADYAQGVNEQLEETARSWVQLGHSLSIFSDISFATKSALIEAAGGFDVLQSSANDFYQGFYSDTEKALNDRDLMMRSLSDSGLYIDPAEGDAAKELFRKTVEEAMSSGQTQLAVELLNMSGLFAQTADYAQQVFDSMTESAKIAAEAAVQSMSVAWSNLGTASGWAAQYLGDSSGLQAQMGMVQASYQGATTVAGRESALGQIIALEESIWQVEEQNRQAAAQAAQKQVQALQGQLSAINSIISATQRLREYAEGLFAGSDSGLNDTERLNVLAAQYSTQLALAKGGDVEAMSKLQGVTSDYLALAEQMSGSQAEYSALSSKIASELASTAFIQEVSAKTQADTLQAQIDGATAAAEQASKQFEVSAATKALIAKQLTDSAEQFAIEVQAMQKQLQTGMDTNLLLEGLPSELTGVLNNTLVPVIGTIADAAMSAASMSAASAEAARQAAASASAAASAAAAAALAGMKVDGSHAGGLSNVPFNGYRAILHKDEAVLTAEENRAYRSSGSSSGSVRTNEIVSAIIAMKNDNRLTSVEMLSRVGQIVRVLNSWDGNGLPGTREETA